MVDRDQVLAHCNLLHHRAQHFLLFSGRHFLRRLVQAAKKSFQRVVQLDPALVLHRSQIQILLLGLQSADFLFDLRRALSEIGQRQPVAASGAIAKLPARPNRPNSPALWDDMNRPAPASAGIDQNPNTDNI